MAPQSFAAPGPDLTPELYLDACMNVVSSPLHDCPRLGARACLPVWEGGGAKGCIWHDKEVWFKDFEEINLTGSNIIILLPTVITTVITVVDIHV